MRRPDLLSLMAERDALARRMQTLDVEIRAAAAQWSKDHGYMLPVRPERIRDAMMFGKWEIKA